MFHGAAFSLEENGEHQFSVIGTYFCNTPLVWLMASIQVWFIVRLLWMAYLLHRNGSTELP